MANIGDQVSNAAYDVTPAGVGNAFKQYLTGFAERVATDFITALGPVVLVGLTLYFVLKGYMAIAGRSQNTIQDTLWEAGKAGLVAFFALSAPNFIAHVLPFVEGLEKVLTQGVAGTDDVWASLNKVFVDMWTGLDSGAKFVNSKSDGFKIFGDDSIMEVISSWLITLFASILLFLAVSLIMLILLSCEVGLAMTLGFGPLFMCCLMFPVTRQWFDGWFRTVVGLLFTMIISVVLIQLLAHMTKNQIDSLSVYTLGCANSNIACSAVQGAADSIAAWNAASRNISLMLLVFIMIFWKIPQIAQSMVGGLSLTGINPSEITRDVNAIKEVITAGKEKAVEKAASSVSGSGSSNVESAGSSSAQAANRMNNNNSTGFGAGNPSQNGNQQGSQINPSAANNRNYAANYGSRPANDERSFNSSSSENLKNHIRGSWGLGSSDKNDKAS
ncbi:type IV secretion system protein [Anaerobiospirillum sp. NML120511]|uniref:type IV secretion system protein n=1 Tax=Anaerobiospirillum sp. NML120511 TaxID=2932819 RepID=UPI001FF2759F|nr:type IV secretion system protein [Anaerobiospirillum sp. NML120511]MCK0535744.1 type IV secretion system protein [Anaerobiospirillum sp. NML120511]